MKRKKKNSNIEDRDEQCLLNDVQMGRREQSAVSIVCTLKPVAQKRDDWQRCVKEYNRE